jgi:tRNA (guanine-N7-)-methyltransferase
MSFTPATPVTSPQHGIHNNLEKVVTKHLHTRSLKPIAAHNQTAFEHAYQWWQDQGNPSQVILDSACGTGESTRYLSQQYPDHWVIGLDQSIKRLQNSQNDRLPVNCLLLHCECTDFWRLAEQAQWRFSKHTLLYPNPYPKTQHLQRRWHGEAAFRSLLNISQTLELRTNWKIYAEEFHQALHIAQATGIALHNMHINAYHPHTTITAFERKYLMSQHELWQVIASNKTATLVD